jgi:regulator of protease activity HflC (stomatin/prohibitin superfamily)
MLLTSKFAFRKIHVEKMRFSTQIKPNPLGPTEFALKNIGSLPLLPFGIFTVKNNHAIVITCFGKFERVASEGLRFTMPIGASSGSVFLGTRSFKLSDAKVVDKRGNPIIVSAIVNFKVTVPQNFVININSNESYIHHQAETIIKNIVSKYPYDSDDDKNLKDAKANGNISTEMINGLQNLVDPVGVEIINVNLTDLNYAPEIAASMLVKQQARAYIDAKNDIADSSIGIAKRLLEGIEHMGLEINEKTKNKLITNIVTVISSGNSVQPTISV